MKGILFTEAMYQSTIQGLKKQTRRIIKQKPEWVFFDDYGFPVINPRYLKGETVYLKEPYIDDIAVEKIFYKFDKSDRQEAVDCGFDYGWKNKLFMPASCARNFIQIIDVRCELVQDISEEDCIAEGVFRMVDPIGIPGYGYDHNDHNFMWSNAKEAYKALWGMINGKDSWDSKPFVYVYDFKLIKTT